MAMQIEQVVQSTRLFVDEQGDSLSENVRSRLKHFFSEVVELGKTIESDAVILRNNYAKVVLSDKEKQSQILALQHDLLMANNKYDAMSSDIQKMQDLREELDDVKTKHKECDEIRQEFESLLFKKSKEIDLLKEQYDASQAAYDQLKEVKFSLESQMVEYSNEKISLKSKINHLEKETAGLLKQVNHLETQNTTLDRELHKLKSSESSSSTSTLSSSFREAELSTFKSRAAEYESQVNSLLNDISRQSSDFMLLEQKYLKEIEATKHMNELLQSQITEYKSEHEVVSTKHKTLHERVLALTNELNDAKDSHAKTSEKLNDVSQQLSHANDLLDKFKQIGGLPLDMKDEQLTPYAVMVGAELEKQGLTFGQLYTKFITLSEDLKSKSDENEILSKSLQTMSAQLEVRLPEFRQQAQQLEHSYREISDLTVKLEKADRLNKHLQTLLNERADEISSLQRRQQTLVRRVHDTQRQLRCLLVQVATLNGQRVVEENVGEAAGDVSTMNMSLSFAVDDDVAEQDAVVQKMISENMVTFTDIVSLHERNQQLLSAIRTLSSDQSEDQRKLERLTEDTDKLRTLLRDAKESIAEFEMSSVNQKRLISTLEKQCEFYRSMCAQNPDVTATIDDESAEVNASAGGDEAMNVSSTSDDGRHSKVAVKRHGSNVMASLCRTMQARIQDLEKRVSQHHDERLAAEKKSRERIQEEFEARVTAQTEARHISSQMTTTKKQNDVLKRRNDDLKEENALLDRRLKEYHDMQGKMEAQLSEFRNESVDKQTAFNQTRMRLSNVESELERLRDYNQALVKERDQLEQRANQSALVIAEIGTLRHAVDTGSSEQIARLSSRAEMAEKQLDQLQRRSHLKEKDLQRQVTQFEMELAELRGKLEAEENAHRETRAMVKSINAQPQLTAQSTSIHGDPSLNLDTLFQTSSAGGGAAGACASHEHAIRQLKDEVDALKARISSNTVDKDLLETRLRRQNAKTQQLQELVKSLEDTLAAQNETATSMRTDFARQTAELNERLATTEAAHEASVARCAELEQQMSTRDADDNTFVALQRELEQLRAEAQRSASGPSTTVVSQPSVAMSEGSASDGGPAEASTLRQHYERELTAHSRDVKRLNELEQQLTLSRTEQQSLRNDYRSVCAVRDRLEAELEEARQRMTDAQQLNERLIGAAGAATSRKSADVSASDMTTNEGADQSGASSPQSGVYLPADNSSQGRAGETGLTHGSREMVVKYLVKEKQVLQSRLDLSRSHVARLEDRCTTLLNQIALLEKRFNEQHSTRQQMDISADSPTGASGVSSDVRQKLSTIDALLQSNAQLRRENDQLQRRNRELEQETDRVRDEARELEAAKQDANAFEEERLKLMKENQLLTDRCRSLSQQMAQLKSDIDSKTEIEDSLKKSEQTLRLSLDEKSAELETMNKQFKELNETKGKLRDIATKYKRDNAGLQQELEEARKSVAKAAPLAAPPPPNTGNDHESLLKEAKARANTLQSSLDRLNSQVDETKVEYDKTKDELKRTTNERRALETELVKLKEELVEWQTKAEDFKTQFEARKDKHIKLTKLYYDQRKALDEATKRVEMLERRVSTQKPTTRDETTQTDQIVITPTSQSSATSTMDGSGGQAKQAAPVQPIRRPVQTPPPVAPMRGQATVVRPSPMAPPTLPDSNVVGSSGVGAGGSGGTAGVKRPMATATGEVKRQRFMHDTAGTSGDSPNVVRVPPFEQMPRQQPQQQQQQTFGNVQAFVNPGAGATPFELPLFTTTTTMTPTQEVQPLTTVTVQPSSTTTEVSPQQQMSTTDAPVVGDDDGLIGQPAQRPDEEVVAEINDNNNINQMTEYATADTSQEDVLMIDEQQAQPELVQDDEEIGPFDMDAENVADELDELERMRPPTPEPMMSLMDDEAGQSRANAIVLTADDMNGDSVDNNANEQDENDVKVVEREESESFPIERIDLDDDGDEDCPAEGDVAMTEGGDEMVGGGDDLEFETEDWPPAEVEESEQRQQSSANDVIVIDEETEDEPIAIEEATSNVPIVGDGPTVVGTDVEEDVKEEKVDEAERAEGDEEVEDEDALFKRLMSRRAAGDASSSDATIPAEQTSVPVTTAAAIQKIVWDTPTSSRSMPSSGGGDVTGASGSSTTLPPPLLGTARRGVTRGTLRGRAGRRPLRR